jgi:hypothetical protein
MDVKPTSRRQRRAWRLQKLAAAREARIIARMAGLDYRVSGESGALVVHTHSLSWHRSKSPNITVPPPGRGWDGSGPVRAAGKPEGRMGRPVNHQQRGKQVTEKATLETTE